MPAPDAAANATIAQPGGDYNTMPYVSSAFAQSAPARLFGLAQLFGLTPPKAETASILELGCAMGSNIIPLAARFPEARIVGIDLTPRHVEEGRKRIEALGLRNIEIRQGDIASLDLAGQSFDCIICHGVYSWVPAAAREAILRIAGQNLTPDGVAYVSYNVLPGWHQRKIVRDLMMFHAGDQGPPEQRIAKARWVLDNVAKITNAGTPYGAKLREEVQQLAGVADYYILGEFLAEENAPCYFRDFNANAESQGLAFLCETEIESCLPETYGPEVGQLIRTMSANQLVLLEQYIDFFMGRTFRQTLLVRADQAARIGRQIMPERARGLHLSGEAAYDAKASGQGKHVFSNGRGQAMTTTSETVRRAVAQLIGVFPETRTMAETIRDIAAAGTPADAAAVADIEATLFNMVMGGMLKVSSVPVRVGSEQAARPRAPAPARLDARMGMGIVTNLRHEATPLDNVTVLLLPLLDGSTDRDRKSTRLNSSHG